MCNNFIVKYLHGRESIEVLSVNNDNCLPLYDLNYDTRKIKYFYGLQNEIANISTNLLNSSWLSANQEDYYSHAKFQGYMLCANVEFNSLLLLQPRHYNNLQLSCCGQKVQNKWFPTTSLCITKNNCFSSYVNEFIHPKHRTAPKEVEKKGNVHSSQPLFIEMENFPVYSQQELLYEYLLSLKGVYSKDILEYLMVTTKTLPTVATEGPGSEVTYSQQDIRDMYKAIKIDENSELFSVFQDIEKWQQSYQIKHEQASLDIKNTDLPDKNFFGNIIET